MVRCVSSSVREGVLSSLRDAMLSWETVWCEVGPGVSSMRIGKLIAFLGDCIRRVEEMEL